VLSPLPLFSHSQIPVIIPRLKQKDIEWKKIRSDQKRTWLDVCQKNFNKSLDHRSFYFKQDDKKKLGNKALLAELREQHERMFANPLTAVVAPVEIATDSTLATSAAASSSSSSSAAAATVIRPVVGSETYCSHFKMQDQNLHEEVWRVVRTVAHAKLSEPQRQLLHEFWVAFVIPFFGVTSIAVDDLLATLADIVPNAPESAASVASTAMPPPPPPVVPSKNDKKKGSSKKDKTASAAAAHKDDDDADGYGKDKDRRKGEDSDSDGEGEEAKSKRSGEGGSTNATSTVTPNLAAALLTVARISKYSNVVPKLMSIHATQLTDIHALAAAASESFGVGVPASGSGTTTASAALALSALTGGVATGSASAVAPSPTAGAAALAMTSTMGTQVKPTKFALDVWRADEFSGMPLRRRIHPTAVTASGDSGAATPARVFMAAPNFFVFFKLYQVLYERLQVAHGLAVRGRSGGVLLHDANGSADATYARFSRLLFDLLSGALDNARFEDECRQTLGAGSFALFTVDKVALQLIKQIESTLLSDTGAAFLSLYAREQFAKHEALALPSEREALRASKNYELAAARLLLEENTQTLVQIQFDEDSKELSMGLVDMTLYTDPKAPADWAAFVSQLVSHPTVAGPAGATLLKAATPMNAFLKKSLKSGAKSSADGSHVVLQRNELQTQLCMRTYKMCFIAGTEDVFVRAIPSSSADAVAQRQRDRQRSQELVSTWLAGQLAAGKAEDDARLLFKDDEDEEDEAGGADGDEDDDEEGDEDEEETPDQMMAMLTGATAVQDEDDEDDDVGDDEDPDAEEDEDDDMEN
jgi:paired amphipathic helix protein Sin3a